MWEEYPDLQESMTQADLLRACKEHGIDPMDVLTELQSDDNGEYDTDAVLALFGY